MSHRRRWQVPLAVTVGATVGVAVVFAVAPSFSGLALLALLAFGAFIAARLFNAPYPGDGRSIRPAPPVLRLWLYWAVALAVLECGVLLAADDLRWPTISAMQDPITTAEPLGRFVAGIVWAAAGTGLVALFHRRRATSTEATPEGSITAVVTVGVLILLAIGSVDDGAMLEPRDAPTWQAVGIDNTPVAAWPWTAWLTIALFGCLAAAAALIHRRGREYQPPGTVPDLLAWLMAPLVGRMLGFAVWLWCGWHFLGR